MDTEPPTGDDLTRMIASIQENVLQRTREPKASPPRLPVGMIIGIVAALGLGTASTALALGLVPHPFAAPAPVASGGASPAAEPESTPTPSTPLPSPPSPPKIDNLTIPSSCDALLSAADYTRLIGPSPLQQLRPVAVGATEEPIPAPRASPPAFFSNVSLYCRWADPQADITYLSVSMGTASMPETAENRKDLAALGYTCSEVSGGQSCQKITENSMYPVDDASTFFVRGDTWIQINQTNFPTSNLLGALVSHLSDH